MFDMMSGHGGHWMWGGMWIFPLLFWILVIVSVILVVRQFKHHEK